MSDTMRHISDKDFDAEVLRSEVPVLVDFWAPWCGPCLKLGPVLETIAKERGDTIKVVKVNVDESSAVTGRMGVMSIPTVMVFHGGELQQMAVGLRSKAELDRLVDRVLRGEAPRAPAPLIAPMARA